jgi:hypothetical protein
VFSCAGTKEDEDDLLLKQLKEEGKSWNEIAKRFPGTTNAIRFDAIRFDVMRGEARRCDAG